MAAEVAAFMVAAVEVVFTAVEVGVGLVSMAEGVLWGAQAVQRRVRFRGRVLMGIEASARASDHSA